MKFLKRLVVRSAIRHSARYERVLGTSLELQILAGTPERGQAAEYAVLKEIDRLEGIFSAYRPDSELRRWQHMYTARWRTVVMRVRMAQSLSKRRDTPPIAFSTEKRALTE